MAVMDAVRTMVGKAQDTIAGSGQVQQPSTTQQVAPPKERNLDDYYSSNPGSKSAESTMTPDAGKAQATGYEAKMGELDPTKTSSALLNEITSQDSPLMQRARQEGVLQAARRGLQNSSIAAGTAQGAVVDRATPLAQQDAKMYQEQQLQNQLAENRATEVSTGRESEVELSNVRAQDEMERTNAQLATDVSKFNVAEQNQMTRDVMNNNAKIDLQGLTGNQSMDLQQMEDSTKMAITKHQTAASMYQSYANQVGNLFTNPSLTPQRMEAMVTGLKNTLAGGAAFVEGMSNVDLTGGGTGRVTIPSPVNTQPDPAPAPAPAPAPTYTRPPRTFGGVL